MGKWNSTVKELGKTVKENLFGDNKTLLRISKAKKYCYLCECLSLTIDQ